MRTKIFSYVIASFSLGIAFYSCEEVGPPINLTGDNKIDTTYVTNQVEEPQAKVVLLEEFTGVDCRNCPDAHKVIEAIEENYPGRVITVSLHSDDFFSIPFGDDQDLRSEEATILDDILGASGKPKGAVDRIKFSNEEEIIIDKYQNWSSYVEQRLAVVTPVNIHITPDFDDESRNLQVEVVLHYTTEVNIENRLSVMILEDRILTKQNDNGTIKPNYEQNQVLRAMLTDPKGLVINETKERGRVIVKQFSPEDISMEAIPDLWVADNLRIVAFVHQFVESKDVFHATEADVKP